MLTVNAQNLGYSMREKTNVFVKKLFKLTIGGAVVFWITTVATSLLPIAVEYRDAFSNWSMQSVWLGSLIAGVIFGCCVSYFLLHFYVKIPARTPILKSVILSSIVFVLVILLIDVPMILQTSSDAIPYFFIGVAFNGIRFLLLGMSIGQLYSWLYGSL